MRRPRKSPRKIMDQGLRLAIEAIGTRYALAKGLGISPSVVLRWRRVPFERVLEVEKLTGIDRSHLCPDLFLGWKRIGERNIFLSGRAEDLEDLEAVSELIREYAKCKQARS